MSKPHSTDELHANHSVWPRSPKSFPLGLMSPEDEAELTMAETSIPSSRQEDADLLLRFDDVISTPPQLPFPFSFSELFNERSAAAVQMKPQDVYLNAWKAVLEIGRVCLANTCHRIQEFSLNVVEIKFVMDDPQVCAHFKSISEIRAMVDRISQSAKKYGLAGSDANAAEDQRSEGSDLRLLLEGFNDEWLKIQAFLSKTRYQYCACERVPSDSLCGLCLFPAFRVSHNEIDSENAVFSLNKSQTLVEFVNCLYHPSCANFWLNKVSLTLPKLKPFSTYDFLL